jgi:hypothetical protein
MKVLLIVIWKVGGPFFTLNGITVHKKTPQSIIRAILYLSLGAIEI